MQPQTTIDRTLKYHITSLNSIAHICGVAILVPAHQGVLAQVPNKRLDMSNAMATDFRRLFPPETRHLDSHDLDRGCARSVPLALARQLENPASLR